MNDAIIANMHAITAEASILPASVLIGLSAVTVTADGPDGMASTCSLKGNTVGDAAERSAGTQTDDGEAGNGGKVIVAPATGNADPADDTGS